MKHYYSKISFILCCILALFISSSYREDHPFYSALKAKTLDIIEPTLTFSSSTINYVTNSISNSLSIFTTWKENKKLKERNQFLEHYFYLYKKIEGENHELRKLIKLNSEIKFKYITGQIISRSNNHLNQNITINVGTKDGVKKWQIALANNNLIGRVIDVSKNTANILLLTDYNSRIPAIGVNSRVKFIASGQNEDNLSCNYLNENQLQEDEIITTSGEIEEILPGLIIGKAVKKDNSFYITTNINYSDLEFIQIVQH